MHNCGSIYTGKVGPSPTAHPVTKLLTCLPENHWEKAVKNELKDFSLKNWKKGIFIYQVQEIHSLVLNILNLT